MTAKREKTRYRVEFEGGGVLTTDDPHEAHDHARRYAREKGWRATVIVQAGEFWGHEHVVRTYIGQVTT